jgi:hypothetical protein
MSYLIVLLLRDLKNDTFGKIIIYYGSVYLCAHSTFWKYLGFKIRYAHNIIKFIYFYV